PGSARGDVHRSDRRLQPPVEVGQAHAPKDARQESRGSAVSGRVAQGADDGERVHRSLSGGLHEITSGRAARRDSWSASRKALTARWTWDLTVPRGWFRTVATSSSRSPSM